MAQTASHNAAAASASKDAQQTIIMNKYRVLSKKGEGTFSEVLKVEHIHTGHQYAIKCMKSLYPSIKQVNELREIQALRRLNPHPNIVGMEEILYDPETGRLAIVLELMHQNVYEMIRHRKEPLEGRVIQLLMFQLLTAICHMHDHGVFHRDIKPENVLVLNSTPPTLKVADLGSCRGLFSQPPYTEYISTRWYRAPECLLTSGYYDYKMDMWGVGCVFFELVSLQPLFPGQNELDQIEKIHHVMGTPNKAVMQLMQGRGGGAGGVSGVKFQEKRGVGYSHLLPKGVSSDAMVELIDQLLIYNPEKRITARQALQHRYFDEVREEGKVKEGGKEREKEREERKEERKEREDEYEPDSHHEEHAEQPIKSILNDVKDKKKKKGKKEPLPPTSQPIPIPTQPPDRKADVVPLPALPHHSPKAKPVLSTSPVRDGLVLPGAAVAHHAPAAVHGHGAHPAPSHPAAPLLVPISVSSELHPTSSYPHLSKAHPPPHPHSSLPPSLHSQPHPSPPSHPSSSLPKRRKKKRPTHPPPPPSHPSIPSHPPDTKTHSTLPPPPSITGAALGQAQWSGQYSHAYSIVGEKGWKDKSKAAKPSPFLSKLSASTGVKPAAAVKWS